MNALLISIFGVLGVLTRYSAEIISESRNHIFPFGTFIVNTLGCFIAGFVYVLLAKKLLLPEQISRAIIVGFCGGLTTFSGYCLQGLNLMNYGEILKALSFLILGLTIGLISVLIGVKSASYIYP